MRVEPIGFYLRLRNQPRLMRMCQHYFFHLLEFFELIVDQTPIPARLHDRFARPI